MQKFISNRRKNEAFQKTPKSQPTLSFQSFFNKALTTVKQKTELSLIRLEQKFKESSSVFVLPLAKRKISQGQNKTVISADLSQSRSKSKIQMKQKSKSQLSQIDEQRLKNLLKKKQQLMLKLRKVDQQLQNPNPTLLLLEQKNRSNSPFEYMKTSHLRPIESRANFKQNNEVTVAQHQKTIQVLSRINNQKMRRQQKLVNDLKKKQQQQLKSIQHLERNKSTLFNSRQSKMALIANINKKQTEKLLQPSVFPTTNQPLPIYSQQLQNQFDQLQDRQIGNNEKILTEETPPDAEIIQ